MSLSAGTVIRVDGIRGRRFRVVRVIKDFHVSYVEATDLRNGNSRTFFAHRVHADRKATRAEREKAGA